MLAVVGPGKAGTALTESLVSRDWTLAAVAGRTDAHTRRLAKRFGARVLPVEDVGREADLIVLSTPDTVLSDVATRVAPSLRPGALVIHLSGASTLDVLAPLAASRPDVEIGSLHPLQTLPEGSGDLSLSGAWCAIEGPVVELARALGMHPIVVTPELRTTYHAAATVASNHLTALLGQVQRLADAAGVPFEAFLPLVAATIDNVAELGPRDALTGPVARGDVATIAAHLEALPVEERGAYRALARSAATLVDRDDEHLVAVLGERVGT